MEVMTFKKTFTLIVLLLTMSIEGTNAKVFDKTEFTAFEKFEEVVEQRLVLRRNGRKPLRSRRILAR